MLPCPKPPVLGRGPPVTKPSHFWAGSKPMLYGYLRTSRTAVDGQAGMRPETQLQALADAGSSRPTFIRTWAAPAPSRSATARAGPSSTLSWAAAIGPVRTLTLSHCLQDVCPYLLYRHARFIPFLVGVNANSRWPMMCGRPPAPTSLHPGPGGALQVEGKRFRHPPVSLQVRGHEFRDTPGCGRAPQAAWQTINREPGTTDSRPPFPSLA